MNIQITKNNKLIANISCEEDSVYAFETDDDVYVIVPKQDNNWLVLYDKNDYIIAIISNEGISYISKEYEVEV